MRAKEVHVVMEGKWEPITVCRQHVDLQGESCLRGL